MTVQQKLSWLSHVVSDLLICCDILTGKSGEM